MLKSPQFVFNLNIINMYSSKLETSECVRGSPTYKEVVFPKVSILNMNTLRNGADYKIRMDQLKVEKPRNFPFRNVSIENMKCLKSMIENDYVKSIKNRFVENMFLTEFYDRKLIQEENAAILHQLCSLFDDHIRLLEKIKNMKKNKRHRYQRNKSLRERKENSNGEDIFTSEGGDIQRNFFHVEIVPIKQ